MRLTDLFASRQVPLHAMGDALVPQVFSDPATEHLATRRTAGLFDFSFMAHVEISGAGCLAYLQYIQTRDLTRLAIGQIYYTLLCNPDGTVHIDATVWRLGDTRYWLFVGQREDGAWLHEVAGRFDLVWKDCTGQSGVLALQGPLSLKAIRRCAPSADPAALRYFHFMPIKLFNTPCQLARLGYTGEFGYEIILPADQATDCWQQILHQARDLGVEPCGFTAADSLRIEAGYILFSRELALPVTPFELGLERLLRPELINFVGADALAALKQHAPARRLVGFLPDRLPLAPAPSACPPVLSEAAACLTSSCLSPLLNRPIGMGLAAGQHGQRVMLDAMNAATVTPLPFYDPLRQRPRQIPAGEP